MAETMILDPPSSPPLLVSTTSDFGALRRRKRRCSTVIDGLDCSSDLPCFSSDPPEPSQEIYLQGSRKRQYRGAWWGEPVEQTPVGHRNEAPRSPRPRKFNRNFDSGIYMNSDASDASLPSSSFGSEVLPDMRNGIRQPSFSFKSTRFHRPDLAPEDRTARTVAGIVQDCVQNDKEVVDLANYDIEHLAPRSLELLSTITRSDHLVDRSESSLREEEYHSLQPSLQLYLGNNLLTQLPSSMWSLDRLTVVSLRNNRLSRLPPAIARLQNLTELNVAGNSLEHLPWELLGSLAPRGKLTRLTVLPNPLQQMVSLESRASIFRKLRVRLSNAGEGVRTGGQAEQAEEAEVLSQGEQIRWTRLVDYYSAINKPDTAIDYSRLPPLLVDRTEADYLALDGSTGRKPNIISTSKVSSLFELAASALYSSNEELDFDPTDLPPRIGKAIETVVRLKDEGGRDHCSICNRKYILNRTQWLEYWHWVPFNQAQPQKMTAVDPDEVFLPFLRRGCSWGCVP